MATIQHWIIFYWNGKNGEREEIVNDIKNWDKITLNKHDKKTSGYPAPDKPSVYRIVDQQTSFLAPLFLNNSFKKASGHQHSMLPLSMTRSAIMSFNEKPSLE